jgi:hypothetical protein
LKKIAFSNNKFTPNANANDLQLGIDLAACDESRGRHSADKRLPGQQP